MDNTKVKIKENINILINSGQLEDAKALTSQYKKIEPNDTEVYSIDAVILMMEDKLEEAEEVLKEGLAKDNENFDLLYNLAYLYERKGNYLDSLINYKKALVKNYYNIDIDILESRIYDLKEKIMENNKNKFNLEVSKIDNILFIDFNIDENSLLLCEILGKYGINVDFAYSGKNPIEQINISSNPIRKLIGITELDGLIDYAKYYNYDDIYIVNSPNSIKNYFKSKGLKILDKNLFDSTDEEIIQYFYDNKLKKLTKYMYVEKSNITIIIPTYNRPYYLNRVLTFMNSYKYIKPKIIVLDSSEESRKHQNQEIIRKFNKVTIIYKQYSSDINFFEKLNRGLKDVDTKYVGLCADDDFFAEEGIIESLKKLDEENSLYSVKGKNLYFTYSMGNLIEYDWFYGLKSENCIERLKDITKGFVPSLIYQVFRTEKFKKMYLFIKENMKQLPENDTFTEYLFYFMVIVTGKIGKINIDLNIRDKSVPRVVDVKNFPHAVKEGNFNDNYKEFCEFLGKYVSLIGEDIEKFDSNISKIFIDFLVNFLKIPQENVIFNNEEFDVNELEKGMRKSWVWPSNL